MEELTDKELHALVSLLDDEDQEVKSHVQDRIFSLGHRIIPFLEKKWEESFHPDIQKELEDMVHKLQFSQLKERLYNWANTSDQDLLTGLWIINTYQYPDLDFAKLNTDMHQIYFDVWTAFNNNLVPHEQIKIINNILFNSLRFSANTKNFHSPGNSMLSNVLDTKKGNPISLCAIYLLIAKKLGLPIYGVNLPNLFVLTYKSSDVNFYINAFNKGLLFNKQDIYNYLHHLKIEPIPVFFDPCTNKDIVLRMLRNLVTAFTKLGENTKIEEIKEMIDILTK